MEWFGSEQLHIVVAGQILREHNWVKQSLFPAARSCLPHVLQQAKHGNKSRSLGQHFKHKQHYATVVSVHPTLSRNTLASIGIHSNSKLFGSLSKSCSSPFSKLRRIDFLYLWNSWYVGKVDHGKT